MARDDPTIYIRIPADLKQRIDEVCVTSRRSFTSEVVARLQETFKAPARALGPVGREMEFRIDSIQTRSEVLALRLELIDTRLDGLRAQMRSSQDKGELKLLQQQIEVLTGERDQVHKQRAVLEAKAHEMTAQIKEAQSSLKSMAALESVSVPSLIARTRKSRAS